MAEFTYLGEPPTPPIEDMGKTRKITVPTDSGKAQVLLPPDPKTGWVKGENLGVDFEDETSIRALRADPRFSEVS